MAKDIVIIPADGQIVFSGSSTHHNVLTVDSQSISITTDNFIIDGGDITARNYIISSSVTHMTQSFSSGSTIFGDSSGDTHKFTGSIYSTGDLYLQNGANDIFLGNDTEDSARTFNIKNETSDFTFGLGDTGGSKNGLYIVSGTTDFESTIGNTPTAMFIQTSNKYVGIGTETPAKELTIEGDISASGDLYLNGSAKSLQISKQYVYESSQSFQYIASGSMKGKSTGYLSDVNLTDKWKNSLASKEYVYSRDFNNVHSGKLIYSGSVATGSTMNVWGDGNFIYACNYSDGLHTYRVSSDGTLTHLDYEEYSGVGYAKDIWGDGNFVYLSDHLNGIHVYSVSTSGSLTHIDTSDPGANATSVWGDGNFIYSAHDNAGLRSYSVDKNGKLTLIDTHVYGSADARMVWGDGNFIYVPIESSGIAVYSVDVSGNLTLVNVTDIDGNNCYSVWGDGKFIYVADYTDGISVYSVDTVGNLTFLDSHDPGGNFDTHCIWGDGRYIYLAGYGNGIHTYSVNSKGKLTHIATDDQGGAARGVWGDENFIYVANATLGVSVYERENAYEYLVASSSITPTHNFIGDISASSLSTGSFGHLMLNGGNFTSASLASAIAGGGGGGGDIDISGTPANNQLAVWTDADTLEGESELTYDGSQLIVAGNMSASGDLNIEGTGSISKLIIGEGDQTFVKAGEVVIYNNENEDVQIRLHNAYNGKGAYFQTYVSSSYGGLEFRFNTGSSLEQKWIVGAYNTEDNFIIRDASNSQNIFRVYANAGTNQLVVNSTGVGVNTGTINKTLTVAGDISASGHLYLQSTKKAYLNPAEDTYLDSDSTDRIRFVAGGQQMLVLDYDTGNRAAFGDTKVGIGAVGDNHLPSHELEVDGVISASGDLFAGSTTGTYFSASNGNVEVSGSGTAQLNVIGNISASGDIDTDAGSTGSFSRISFNGNQAYMYGRDSTIYAKSNLTVASNIVATAGDLTVGGSNLFIGPGDGALQWELMGHNSGLLFRSASATKMMITDESNVVINSTVDSGKRLQVTGDISASGNYHGQKFYVRAYTYARSGDANVYYESMTPGSNNADTSGFTVASTSSLAYDKVMDGLDFIAHAPCTIEGCKIIGRSTVGETLQVTIWKGSLVNASNAGIALTEVAEYSQACSANTNYFFTGSISSNNALAENDFVMTTIKKSTDNGTAYLYYNGNLELRYT